MSSLWHCAQRARSGEIAAEARGPRGPLATMEKRAGALPWGAAVGIASTPWTREAGGASDRSAARSASMSCAGPTARISTPSASFRTHPRRPSRVATWCTKGRKPTPCTTPRTRSVTSTSVKWDRESAPMKERSVAGPRDAGPAHCSP
jgi:hypothetical protein